ncbi:ESX secretion-associated protein EspG [Nocardia sp. NPDC052566]|uniref:ESX secretion-associated protein EspG n=1 Tax=Nocardia sp. NPDC052566 TaxID=3364330 RepID=UPI0037C55CA5
MSAPPGRTWRLTDLEFVVGWEAMGDCMLPEPFYWLARATDYYEFEREKRETLRGLRNRFGQTFDTVLAAVARPDIRVVVSAENPQAMTEPESPIRLLGARRHDNGYLVTQLPGETVQHSGGYTVTEFSALDLAKVVVNALPTAPAGQRTEIQLVTGTGRYGVTTARGQHFLQLPATAAGVIEVVQGVSIFGPRGITRRTLYWRDVLDDGRYLITDNHATVVPADPRRLTAAINNAIAEVVQAIREERS